MSPVDELLGEPTEALFTFREAAHACGVSRDTIKRRHRLGQFPRAAQDEHGVWQIPAADLIAAGLPLGVVSTVCPEPPPLITVPPASDELAALRARAEVAEAEVADLRRRAEVAEAVARERADALADARLALRALTEGERPTAPVPEPSAPAPPGPAEHRAATPEPARGGGVLGSFRRFLGA